MASNSITFASLDQNLLLSYFQAQAQARAQATAVAASATSTNSATTAGKTATSATSKDLPPWQGPKLSTEALDAKALATTNFLDTKNIPLGATVTADAKTEQDNQRLFSLYTAVNTLSYLAKIAGRDTTPSGQLPSLNTRFQAGLQQIRDFIANTKFNNFTLQAAAQSATATSTAGVQFLPSTYKTRPLVFGAAANEPLSGLNASDSFTIAVTNGGSTTNVAIDLSQVSGDLTLSNVVAYINDQLSASGVKTRFQKVLTSGSLDKPETAQFGLQIAPGGNETISLSAASAPSLYLAGSTGTAVAKSTTAKDTAGATSTTAKDQEGRLIKLSNLDSSPTSAFSNVVTPTSASTSTDSTSGATNSATSTAQATQVDADGNVYVIGSTNGDFGTQLNQGAQDAYLTKYDSAGSVLWTRLLGSTETASGYSLALNPTGGVVVTGSTTADLVSTAIADGNSDTFVAKYAADGTQTWVKQLQTVNNNQGNAVSVDASGNIYIGGQVKSGSIGSGQVSQGGSDGYVAKLNASGTLLYEQQIGTSGTDQVSATATAADGSLYVASVQNGHAIISKYANGDATVSPVWQTDLGDLQDGGAIGGLTVSGGAVYVSGTTGNSNLTAGGTATIASASSGKADAFVFKLSDTGNTATPNFVSYVGTGETDKGGAVTVGSNGTIYLTGTTSGTFAGESRSLSNTTNLFATSLSASGTINWTRQFGGLDGQSAGAGIAIDESGSSVLDALGLPRGEIGQDQTVDLTEQTTLRAGDSFKIQFQGSNENANRTSTITIEKGETLSSLAAKINIQLQAKGKASVVYGGVEKLKIAVKSGVAIKLVAGPKDFDALSRLGLSAGTLSNTSTTSGTKSKDTTIYGIGLATSYDISTKAGGNFARSQLLGVLSSIQSAYQKSNAPAPAAVGPGIRNGKVSAYEQAQLASSQLALSLLT